LERSTPVFIPWIGSVGNVVFWTGEIYGRESDMPGTYSDRCYFTDCQYQVDSIWNVAGFFSPGIYWDMDDINEWNYQRLNQTSFEIWDVHPMPSP
jgi:hypothetical protein